MIKKKKKGENKNKWDGIPPLGIGRIYDLKGMRLHIHNCQSIAEYCNFILFFQGRGF